MFLGEVELALLLEARVGIALLEDAGRDRIRLVHHVGAVELRENQLRQGNWLQGAHLRP